MNSTIYPLATNSEWRADISQHSSVSTPNGPGPSFLGPSESMHLVLYLSWILHECTNYCLFIIPATPDFFSRTQSAWSSF